MNLLHTVKRIRTLGLIRAEFIGLRPPWDFNAEHLRMSLAWFGVNNCEVGMRPIARFAPQA
jgi:hypothetical protein